MKRKIHVASADDGARASREDADVESGSVGSSEQDSSAHSRRDTASFSSSRRTTFALPEQRTHHCFLSHKKAHSQFGSVPGQVAKNIHDSLELLGFASWFDIDALKNISKTALRDGIRGCVGLSS